MNNMDMHHANYFSSLQKNTQSVDTERSRVNPHSFKVTQTLLASMCGEWISGALAPLHMTEVMKIFILFCSDFALMFTEMKSSDSGTYKVTVWHSISFTQNQE